MIFVVQRITDNGLIFKPFSSGVHAHMFLSTRQFLSGEFSSNFIIFWDRICKLFDFLRTVSVCSNLEREISFEDYHLFDCASDVMVSRDFNYAILSLTHGAIMPYNLVMEIIK